VFGRIAGEQAAKAARAARAAAVATESAK